MAGVSENHWKDKLNDNSVFVYFLEYMTMNWDKNLIGEKAGIVWRVLNCNEMSWDELLKNTGFTPLELASTLGWLTRENKINVHTRGDVAYFSIYHESYF